MEARYLAAVELKPCTRRTVAAPAALRVCLAEVWDKGYAWVDGAFDEAVCGLSVPVRGDAGQVVAALNVNPLSGEVTEAKAAKRLLMPLREAAERLRAMAPNLLGAIAQTSSRSVA